MSNNLGETFMVSIPTGEILKGRAFPTENAVRNLLIQTGMCEHSARYAHFAHYLNENGINVYVMDAVGQGLNSPKVEDQQKWFEDAFEKNVQALHEKIVELRKTGLPTSLFGHSMGSFMTQRYLQLYPNTLDSVIICGSNGPQPFKMWASALAMKFLANSKNHDQHSPFCEGLGLGPYINAYGKVKDKKDMHKVLAWISKNEENVERYIADPYCGAPTTRGFWKEFTKGLKALNSRKARKMVSPDEHILIIGGDQDPVGEKGKGLVRLEKSYRKYGVKDVTLILYPTLRHEILNEKENAIVYKDVLTFIDAH